ncbi:MAG: dTMP kinase, partial [Gemmatimonadales bacterium]|nr:dTMP kinase [Gemmatimonadales bacterium]
MTRRGFFVVLEGPEGSGKSTLVGPLAERMRASGVDPLVVREPGSTRAAEIARQALLDPEHPVGPLAELFLYLAARADLVQSTIRPALDAGRVVLSDRFALSTEAYQMAGRGLDPGLVRAGNQAATGGVCPDLTLILDLVPELGQARQLAAGKRQDRLDRESMDFHRRV